MLVQDHKQIFWKGTPMHAAYLGSTFMWPKKTPEPLDRTVPFYVENITNSTETVHIRKRDEDAPTITIYKSNDGSTWDESPIGSTSYYDRVTFTLAPGQRIYLRSTATTWCTISEANHRQANVIYGCSKVGGNLFSLLYGPDFTGYEIAFPSGSHATFSYLFSNEFDIHDHNTYLRDASELYFTDQALVSSAYAYMFLWCINLVNGPLILPAMTTTFRCYNLMFCGCTSLLNAPKLPATTLAQCCYESMFASCTSLITAPVLPAATLVGGCYNKMFAYCTSLNYVKSLATSGYDSIYHEDNLSALGGWLDGVSATGTFVKVTGTEWPSGTFPSGWTIIEE